MVESSGSSRRRWGARHQAVAADPVPIGNETVTLRGLHRVDEQALNALDDAAVVPTSGGAVHAAIPMKSPGHGCVGPGQASWGEQGATYVDLRSASRYSSLLFTRRWVLSRPGDGELL